ncbi:hypothetical protein F5883DRAFT_554504 [Diaporthe sp. PMI_573]|nr:hypothetical protein F5883DRAFT_554504 [Diaporthaceae sp. PMI_573]
MLDNSPYSASSITLCCKGGARYSVPSPLLRKHSKLGALCSSFSTALFLENVSQDVGHVLVHYLFTDTYQCLRPKGQSEFERLVAECTTSIRVYAFARGHGLQSLEELAKSEVDRLGAGLPISLVLNLIQEAYPNPSVDDTWINSYFKARLRSLFQNPAEELECRHVLNTDRKTMAISEIFVNGLLELLNENLLTRPTCLGVAHVPIEVPERPPSAWPGSELKPQQEIASEPEKRQALKVAQPSCERNTVLVPEVTSEAISARKPNAKGRRKIKRELRQKEAKLLAEQDIWENTNHVSKRREVSEDKGSGCRVDLKEDTENVNDLEEFEEIGLP